MENLLSKLRSEKMSNYNINRHEKLFLAKLMPEMQRSFMESGFVLQSQPKRAEGDKQLTITIVLDLKRIASDLKGHMILHVLVDYLIYQNQLSVVRVGKSGFDAREIGPDAVDDEEVLQPMVNEERDEDEELLEPIDYELLEERD